MRHCMVVHSYYPFDETRVQRQAEALVDRGYEVDVICLRHGEEPAAERVAGAMVYRLPVRRDKRRGGLAQLVEYLAFMALAFLRLTALHLRRRYNVVQIHNLPDFLVFAALVPRLTGSRVILDIHDLMPEFYCARFHTTLDSWPARLLRWQEWLACHFAHHVITVTEAWRQTLLRRSVPPGRCSVVMNVADSRYFDGGAPPERGQDSQQFRLIYHGTLTERYGVDLVLQALAQVRGELPGLCCIVHGRGEHLNSLRRLADELRLHDCVRISTDFLPTAELPWLIRSADLGVVPYRRDVFTDGILPTKLMEYMALGVPAVVARTPGISAYFDESMVEFFDPENVDDLARHIRALYHDRARLRDLAGNTARFRQQYSWASQSAGYVRLVDDLAGAS